MWTITVSNHGLKLKPPNYTPKGRGAHSVEKQELSVLDACLRICCNLFPFHQDKDMKSHWWLPFRRVKKVKTWSASFQT